MHQYSILLRNLIMINIEWNDGARLRGLFLQKRCLGIGKEKIKRKGNPK